MAACAEAGRVNALKLNATCVPEAKFPPAVMDMKTFKTWPIIVAMHVAPEAGAVTVHALLPMVGDPESVMRMAD